MLLSGCFQHRIHHIWTDEIHIARVVGPTDKDIHFDSYMYLPYPDSTRQKKGMQGVDREKTMLGLAAGSRDTMTRRLFPLQPHWAIGDTCTLEVFIVFIPFSG